MYSKTPNTRTVTTWTVINKELMVGCTTIDSQCLLPVWHIHKSWNMNKYRIFYSVCLYASLNSHIFLGCFLFFIRNKMFASCGEKHTGINHASPLRVQLAFPRLIFALINYLGGEKCGKKRDTPSVKIHEVIVSFSLFCIEINFPISLALHLGSCVVYSWKRVCKLLGKLN